MKRILGYYMVPPGELWVRFDNGEMMQVTGGERALAPQAEPTQDGLVPDRLGADRIAMDWQDPRCRQPQTGSVRRYAA